MADNYTVLGVTDSSGNAYQQGTDWTDNGDGTIDIPGGSSLSSPYTVRRSKYSDTAPTGPFQHRPDADYCGLRKIAAPDTAWASGTDVNISAESLHIVESAESQQGRIRFIAWAEDSTAQGLDEGDYIAVRVGTEDFSGNAIAQQEWRGVVTQREAAVTNLGERIYNYVAFDFWELLKTADTSSVPTELQTYLITYPQSDTTLPPQMGMGGPVAYTLKDLLDDVMPANLDYVFNVPDVMIERLPENGTAVDMIANVLNATGYIAYWDKSTLVIEQHEHSSALISAVLTDSIVFEVARRTGNVRQINTVDIKRPTNDRAPATAGMVPDKTIPPQGETGAFKLMNEADLAYEDTSNEDIVWRARFRWEPDQIYTQEEPAPMLLGFSDGRYNRGIISGGELSSMLIRKSAQIEMEPQLQYTTRQIWGPAGFDWYFLLPLTYYQIRFSGRAEGWVVSKSGYYSESGAVSRFQRPVAGANVLITGENTGATYQVTTNADGYWRVEDAIADAYTPLVWLDDDTYLANKNAPSGIFPDGLEHPYDDDPTNDNLGPNLTANNTDLFQIDAMDVDITVTLHRLDSSGPDERSGTNSDYNTSEDYRPYGGFSYGDGTDILTIDEINNLGMDTANITTEWQADQFAEQQIDNSAERQDQWLVTKPFGGEATSVGKVVRIDTATDDAIEVDCRVVGREIRFTPKGLVKEVLTNTPVLLVAEFDKRYATRTQVQYADNIMLNRQKATNSLLLEYTGRLRENSGLGVLDG